jgi:hypothetical protein
VVRLKFIARAFRLCILKNAREFFARDQKQGSTSRSSADENGFGLPLRIQPFLPVEHPIAKRYQGW